VPASRSNPSLPKPRYLDAGESAIVVEFGRIVDVALHDRVLALDAQVTAAKIDGVTETVPTYRSLMVYYDSRRLGRDEIVAHVERLLAHATPVRIEAKRRTVPVCYSLPYAEDLADVARRLQLSEARIVELFTRATYRLYMFGFLPGFAYLGRLPKELEIPRRETPRSPTPMGAVQIAGEQVVITGVAMTTGWYMIGRTPMRVFDLARETPFIFDVGDEIVFEPIDAAEFERLQ
jgi:KipI family sensor histidine kinase inhibitor